MAQVRKILGAEEKVRVIKAAFTVTDTAITGGTDGGLKKLLVGGPAKLRRLKKLGIRA